MVSLILGRYKTPTLVLLLASLILDCSEAKKLPYGSPCKNNKQCQEGFESILSRSGFGSLKVQDFLNADQNSECRNSRCDCSGFQVRVFQNSNYMCVKSDKLNFLSTGDQASTTTECKANDTETCLNGVCVDIGINIIPNRCNCNDGFVYDGVNCKEFVNTEHFEDCKSPESGPVPLCNYDSMMMCMSTGKCECYEGLHYDAEGKTCMTKESYMEKYPENFKVGLNEICGASSDGWTYGCNATTIMSCQSSKCKCKSEFYPLEANKTCESKDSYVKEHNLTEYKVMPGVYCFNENDCISGLYCKSNHECACPYPCKYDSIRSACDCGQVSAVEGASYAILCGVFGGIVIIAFWGHLINKTMKKGKTKSTGRQWGESIPISNPEPVTVPLVYHASAPSGSTMAPVGFTAATAPLPDAKTQLPSNASYWSTSPALPTDYSKSHASNNAPFTPNQSPGLSRDPTLDPLPGSVPPAYTPSGSSDPTLAQYASSVPSAYPPSGPSPPLPFSPTTETGTSDDPPPYYSDNPHSNYDIYKPIIS